jgi:hypothetical protein
LEDRRCVPGDLAPKADRVGGVLDPLPDRRRLDTAASGPIQGGNMAQHPSAD